MKTAMEIVLSQRVIAFNPIFSKIAGDVVAGIFLSQCCFLSRTHGDSDGWFYSTSKQWTELTTMTRRQIESARATLNKLGILYHKVKGQAHKTYYRIDWPTLEKLIIEHDENSSKNAQKSKTYICENELVKNCTDVQNVHLQMYELSICKCTNCTFANARFVHTKRVLKEELKENKEINTSVEKDTRNIKEAIAENAAAMTKEQAQAQLAVLFKRSQKYTPTPTAKPSPQPTKRLSNDELEELARSDGLTQGYDPSNNAELRH